MLNSKSRVKDRNNENTISNNMLDYIKNDDKFIEDLLSKDNNITFKVKRMDGRIKVIKFGACFICKRKIEGSEHLIILPENGGTDDNENKVFLCSTCRDDVELNCEMCKNNIKNVCNKELFTKCWISGYPSNISGCYNMVRKINISSNELDKFKCKICNQKLLRSSVWDKEHCLSNEWYATFKCIECNKTYDIKMSKDIMNWVIDNIQTSFNE